MAFNFSWPEFDSHFVDFAREALEQALNRASKPSNICDTIKVKTLHMGSQPPELDILEIGELCEERFRGIFKFTYLGDAHVILQTKVQANPLNFGPPTNNDNSNNLMGPDMLVADAPLVVPLELRISDVKIRGIFVLIISLTRGVTISFKNDPLEGVKVSSTFDNVPSIRNHLQREIQQRLAALFRDELPLIIHHMSLDKIRKFADQLPSAFRTPIIPQTDGSFRNRRSNSVGNYSLRPSRTNSPLLINNPQENFGSEVFYFRRHSMIHRTTSGNSICDPLIENTCERQPKHPSLMEELGELLEKIPIVGDGAKEYLNGYLKKSPKSRSDSLGLKDPILFQAKDQNNSTEIQPGGTIKPSIYKATKSDRSINDSMNSSSPVSLDPEEFRSVDSLLLTNSRSQINTEKSQFYRHSSSGIFPKSLSWNPSTLQRSVLKTSLSRKLSILRTLHDNPSPFELNLDEHIVHRSQFVSRPTQFK